MDHYGDRPPNLSEQAALSQLLASKDLYGSEPQNLADYDLSKLKVGKGHTVPQDAGFSPPPG